MKMNMNKNLVGYIRLYRYIALEYKKSLTDPEYRLLDVYASLVRWDKKDGSRFGTVDELSIRDLQKEYLPEWSTGKISMTIKKLINRGMLARLPKKRMRVENFWFYQAQIQRAEQGFQLIEQGIQPTEQNVQLAEQKKRDEFLQARQKTFEKLTSFSKNVQPNEQNQTWQRN